MPKRPLNPTETPLCIRFRPNTRHQIAECAAKDGMIQSVWIRDLAVERAERLLNNLTVEPLVNVTAGGKGEQICIRFKPDVYDRIVSAAARESILPSPWIRAIVMQRVEQMLSGKQTVAVDIETTTAPTINEQLSAPFTGIKTVECCHGTKGCLGAGDKHWCTS